ncbi:MAG: thioredoxin domain-containing protein [Candidatus Peribacteria bacterium]|jgi:protein-disulfide isomerase|nr:thioredoxin domain-containing protein [Candidatus Peribacteria bacterium]
MMTKEPTQCHRAGKLVLIVLLVINLVLSSCAFYYSYQNYDLEVIRGGGKANFNAMNKFYRSEAFVKYVTEAQAQQLASFDQLEQPADTNDTEAAPTALDQASLAALKADVKIKGNPNAEITIIEYADANCGFCKQQIAQTKTLQTIMESYPNVNMIYKNMPVLGSVEEAQIIECFGKDSTVDNYYAFVEAVYANNAGVENLYTLATSLGGNADAIKACVKDGTYQGLVDAQMAEGRSFKINGTPASLVINNTNGTYKLVEGAQPVANFEATINSLLNG